MPRSRLILATFLLTLVGASCARSSIPPGPYSGLPIPSGDHAASLQWCAEAKPLLASDPSEAESLLRKALDADPYNGTAHNNLGVLLLKKQDLYEAAREFEWARKLLPGHPDPRVNLAIALQAACKFTDAAGAARSALEVQPGHLGAIQVLATIQIEGDLTDDGTVALLSTITERCPDSAWSEWATRNRLRLETRSDRPK